MVAVAAPLTGVEKAPAALAARWPLVGALVMPALLVLSAWIVTLRQGLLPLERIARTAGRTSRRATCRTGRACPTTTRRSGRPGRAFDAMLDQIEASRFHGSRSRRWAAVARSEERLRRFDGRRLATAAPHPAHRDPRLRRPVPRRRPPRRGRAPWTRRWRGSGPRGGGCRPSWRTSLLLARLDTGRAPAAQLHGLNPADPTWTSWTKGWWRYVDFVVAFTACRSSGHLL